MEAEHPPQPSTATTPTHQPIVFSSPQALVLWMQMDSLRVQCGTSGAHANMLNQPEMAMVFFSHAQAWEKMRDDFHKQQASQIKVVGSLPEGIKDLAKKT